MPGEAGQRDVAIAEWQAGANAGEAAAMLALGRLYLRGIGLPQNYVQAHKWFNLAASRGEGVAAAERDALVAQMTAQERVEAQKLALEWQPSEAPTRARPAPAPPGLLSDASAEAIRETQALLAALGYQPGPADGVWGGQTTQALQDFLRTSGQSPPPTLTETLHLLRIAQRPVVQQTTNTPIQGLSDVPGGGGGCQRGRS